MDPTRANPLLGLILALLTALVLAGCDQNASEEESGELYISLTDEVGDFVTYTVAVSRLTLQRADGAVVETLAEPVEVDFTQYVELSELLTAATVPSGIYVRATLLLDYTGADIRVEDESGEAVPVTQVVDAGGQPIEALEVSVRLEGRNALTIAPGVPAHLSLDFDLDASNEVRFDPSGTPSVTVEPFLVAELAPEAPKPARLRGALAGVETEADRFTLLLRPFHRPLDRGRFGRLTVVVNETTQYEIDGTPYTGAEGLLALDAQPDLTTPVVALGELKFDPVRYVATEVLAGSSVPGGTLDVVRGHVVARTGDLLTVKGARVIRASDRITFNDEVTIDLSGDPVVLKQGGGCDPSTNPCDKDDISVGQRILAFGTWDETRATLDAARVRLMVTTARGEVIDASTRSDIDANTDLVIDLQGFDRRPVGLFDFTGTGATPSDDADPTAYEIEAASLTPPPVGSAVKLRGFVQRFGDAPPDFEALSVVDVSAVSARYGARWDPTASDALVVTPEALTVDDDSARTAGILRRGVHTDLTEDGQATRIQPRADGAGVFLVKRAGTVTLHTTFGAFIDDLAARLADGASVHALTARGRYDESAGPTLTARRIAVRLG